MSGLGDEAERDRLLFGTGIEVDGKRVDPARVTVSVAAPAPSSLAGGEALDRFEQAAFAKVQNLPRGAAARAEEIARRDAEYDAARNAILAALSPEAPAREGVVKACADFQEAIDYFEADVADALAEDSERADLWDREVTVNIDALKTVMLAALTPRHEAPAEKAEYVDAIGALSERTPEAPAEGAGKHDPIRSVRTIMARAVERKDQETLDHARIALDALRARSSAPETREEALGNLLAVIHGDGGHRALEVGVEQAAAEAEKIVANLLSSAPEAREDYSSLIAARCVALPGKLIDCPVCLAVDDERDRQAAPSADKLREVVEGFVSDLTGSLKSRSTMLTINHNALTARIDQALAALEAEGA